MIHRILITHSTQDPAVDDRIAAIAKNPALANNEFHHTYFITPQDEEALSIQRPQDFLRENEPRLALKFEREIEINSIDLLVLHSGVAFYIAPQTVLSIFETLKDKHPQLKLGLQKGFFLDQVLNSEGPAFANRLDTIFDQAPEIQSIIKLLF
jgi:hypothetical protein